MKSKLTAKEKHLQDKIVQLQKDNNMLVNKFKECNTENRKLKLDNTRLQEENQQQEEWIERLLQYTELNEKDIKIACEKDKELFQMFGFINKLNVYGGMM